MKRLGLKTVIAVAAVLATAVVASRIRRPGTGERERSARGSKRRHDQRAGDLDGTRTITWTTQATLSDTGLDSQITYTVERKLGAGSFAEVGSGRCLRLAAPRQRRAAPTPCRRDGTYSYRVIAHYHSWTAASNEASVIGR